MQVWKCPLKNKREIIMAKGQVRSNREVRKPKKDKSAAPDTSSAPLAGRFPSQVKDTGKTKK